MNEPLMKPCEVFEASLSALIDGELEVPDQLPAVDHLLDCASCRAFYAQARALDDMLVESRSRDADPAPERLWEAIAAESGVAGGSAKAGRGRRWPRWAMQLAATLLLGAGLWWAWPALEAPLTEVPVVDDIGRVEDDGGPVAVVLEEDRGSMSDERFVELATELLKADRRYHRQMLEVMSVVTEATRRTEGSVDERPPSENVQRISLGDGDSDGSFRFSGDRL